MTAEITDPELALYGAGETITDRLAREVSDLRAQRVASRERVREVVRGAVEHVMSSSNDTWTAMRDDIAARAAEQLDGQAAPDSRRRVPTVEEFVALRRALWTRLEERQTMTSRIYDLLATEPAVSEERCGEIERIAGSDTPPPWSAKRDGSARTALVALLAAARQLHALRAGLREIVGGEATSAPTRAALDSQQLLDLQRMRADYEHALGRARQRAANFPGIQAIADGVAEYTRWVALLDHLLSIFGGTQT